MTVACSHEVTAWNRVCLVESGATSILLSPSHDCDEHLRHRLRLRLWCRRRNRESQHASSPAIFPLPPLLSVSLHLVGICICALNCGEARSDIPAETTDMAIHPPRPNRPSDGDWLGHRHIRARTHIAKALFIWGKRKEAFLISFNVTDLWRRGCMCMSAYGCAWVFLHANLRFHLHCGDQPLFYS